MTFLEMRTYFRILADDRNADGFPDTEVNLFLNRAQEDIQNVIDEADEGFFSACQTYDVEATDDSYEFDLPANHLKLVLAEELVTNSAPIPAKWVPFARRHEQWECDRPTCYLRGTKVGVVAPQRDYTLRVWYVKRLAELVNDGDVSEIPLEHHALVCLSAARTCALADGKDFSNWEQDYQQKMAGLATFIEDRERQESQYIHVTEDDA